MKYLIHFLIHKFFEILPIKQPITFEIVSSLSIFPFFFQKLDHLFKIVSIFIIFFFSLFFANRYRMFIAFFPIELILNLRWFLLFVKLTQYFNTPFLNYTQKVDNISFIYIIDIQISFFHLQVFLITTLQFLKDIRNPYFQSIDFLHQIRLHLFQIKLLLFGLLNILLHFFYFFDLHILIFIRSLDFLYFLFNTFLLFLQLVQLLRKTIDLIKQSEINIFLIYKHLYNFFYRFFPSFFLKLFKNLLIFFKFLLNIFHISELLLFINPYLHLLLLSLLLNTLIILSNINIITYKFIR